MKPKIILCLALVLRGVLATFSTRAADTNSLRVVVIPSKTEVRVKETFKVTLRVENPTTTNQTVRVMSCSWYQEWQTRNTNISWIGWICTRNVDMNVKIPPGGAYTNELEMFIPKPIFKKTLSFRMGFTPIGSETTFWSDAVVIAVAPVLAMMTNQINQATSLLMEFKKSKSADPLEKTLRAAERIPFPGIDTVARREQAKLWLSLLATIDQNIDPSFDDPHNPPNAIAIK